MPVPEKDNPEDQNVHDDDLRISCSGQMTLEAIIDSTGELEHLNELIMLSLEKYGGFTGSEDYLKTVNPILDLLEVEIRIRYSPGTTRNQMKLVIQDWIDKEIADLR